MYRKYPQDKLVYMYIKMNGDLVHGKMQGTDL